MIEIIATAESIDQAKKLIDVGVDTIVIGEEEFGLRLPAYFTMEEMDEITKCAHEQGKKIYIAVNGIFHNDKIEKIVPYLQALKKMKVDAIYIGDPGAIHLLKQNNIDLSFIYDAHTFVTSARQVNFWVNRGAKGAVLARELTEEELYRIQKGVDKPVEVLVYGATCIHHSKRPLVENYFDFTEQALDRNVEMFLAEPKEPETHYSIFEDSHGTHIFNTDDVNLFPYLERLAAGGIKQWKLDGIYTRGETFIQIAEIFVQAKERLKSGNWTEEWVENANEKIEQLHPAGRTLDAGFFLKDPDEVK